MPRLIRVAVSFVIALVAYGAYALVAVPLIEPSSEVHRDGPITEDQRQRTNETASNRLRQLDGLIRPGSWELTSPRTKILESDRVKLLMEEYVTRANGEVQIRPCTIIFLPEEGTGEEADRKRQAVVLEAPEGAVLQFDQPFDLKHMKIGRLIAGQLPGQITIRSGGKSPGPEDDLLIVTREVALNEKEVRTPHEVDFRWGPNFGRGRDMLIKLLPGDESKQTPRRGPNIGGVDRFEMKQIERLHLELGKTQVAAIARRNGESNGAAPAAAGPARAADAKSRPSGSAGNDALETSHLAVEVACRGPFVFDVVQKVARFENRVTVSQVSPDGVRDQLDCEQLSIYFVQRDEALPSQAAEGESGANPSGAALRLRPQRLEAVGSPVVLAAPSRKLLARGERLEFDLLANRIFLEDGREALLQQADKEIRARSLEYQWDHPKRIGRVAAVGPGSLRGQMADRPGEQLEAHWSQELSLRPDDQNQLISLRGDVSLEAAAVGKLDAGEIHFWLTELPIKDSPNRYELRPDRMLARNQVRLQSAQASGAVEQLEIWFEMNNGKIVPRWKTQGEGAKKAGPHTEKPEGAPNGAQQGAAGFGSLPALGTRSPFSSAGELALPVFAAKASANPVAPAEAAPRQHFAITARLLQARVTLQENEPAELTELRIEDGVRFVETQTAQAGERPVEITGNRVRVVDVNRPTAAVTVLGEPARFSGRGLALTGANINVNRGTNRLWIDGAGQMNVAMDRDLDGNPLQSPGTLQVVWQGEMELKDRTARFEEAVVAEAPQRQLQTETLEVQFTRPIDFSNPKLQQRPDIERIVCRGGVAMENVTVEGSSQTSHERMQVADLSIHALSGELTAGGPGTLVSVRRGAHELPGRPLGLQSPRPPMTSGNSDRLNCLHVRFQGSVTGNIRQQQMTFHNEVQTAYAPVDSWGAMLPTANPDALGADGVVMRCDRLGVTRMAAPTGGRPSIEIEAAGNTVVEGMTFTARAARITYDETKGMLILEGDARNDAELFRQQNIGGLADKQSARKIYYWPKTGQAKVEGARSVELNSLPPNAPGRK